MFRVARASIEKIGPLFSDGIFRSVTMIFIETNWSVRLIVRVCSEYVVPWPRDSNVIDILNSRALVLEEVLLPK